jgi:hypothetical protein
MSTVRGSIADVTPPWQRAAHMGLAGAAFLSRPDSRRSASQKR